MIQDANKVFVYMHSITTVKINNVMDASLSACELLMLIFIKLYDCM